MSAKRTKYLFSVACLLLVAGFALPLRAQDRSGEKEWTEILAAAKKEGKVVIHGPSDAASRRDIPVRFQARFGIVVEYISGRSSELGERLRRERQAGLSTLDVYMSGFSTAATVLYPERMLDPLKPVLALPEVIDSSKWKPGKLWFMDPEEKYILRLFNNVSSSLSINTKHVKSEELRQTKDLLTPKWKGKISTYDPRGSGSGRAQAARWYFQFGEDFIRKLYVEQKPVFSRDDRQLVDWLLRGVYPIALGAPQEEIEQLRKEGLPVTDHNLGDDSGYVSMGNGALALMKGAPHPNAARVFVNWLASKEGLETYARAHHAATTRNDVDESFLPPGQIPRPGVKYFDSADWNYTVDTKKKVESRLTEIIGR
jgi:iron(III) transport system substrate-binding protein